MYYHGDIMGISPGTGAAQHSLVQGDLTATSPKPFCCPDQARCQFCNKGLKRSSGKATHEQHCPQKPRGWEPPPPKRQRPRAPGRGRGGGAVEGDGGGDGAPGGAALPE